MKRLFFSLLIFTCSLVTFAQNSTKLDKIYTFLELSGYASQGELVAKTLLNNFKDTYPDVPQEFWDKALSKINGEELKNIVAPIYDKYYTEEDIDALIAFYKSDIGKKVLQVTPMVTRESMEAGKQWGQKLAEEIIEELEFESYI